MKKLLRRTGDRSNPVLTLFFAVVALAALVGAQVADAQNGTAPASTATHGQRGKHHAPVATDGDSAEALLDADDARFFLTRVGFAPDNAEVAQYVGLTRAQTVDKVLSTARREVVVAATYDGATLRFYKNGVEISNKAFTASVGSADIWRIGAYSSSPYGAPTGLIDDVRIYSRALSAQELRSDMDAGVALSGGQA